MNSQTNRRNTLICAAMLLAFAAVTLIGVLNHELWFDEAQAWVIARDATCDNFAEIMKHEGHPALWYLILMPFAKLGAPCETLSLISWLFSVLSAGLFLWKAPFGLCFKSMLVFSSGYLFFDSVNARVYCIIPVLLYLIAIVYPKREKYAPLYGLLVGLLANTHIMMCGLVGIFGIFMLIELFQGIRRDGWKKSAGKIAGLAVAGLLVICMILPLLGSVSVNNMMDGKSIGAGSVAYGAVSVFTEIGQYLTAFPFSGICAALGALLGATLILYMVCLFSYRKAFVFSLVFALMYGGLVGGFWYTTQLRAPVFLYTLVAVLWIAVQNEEPRPLRLPENSGLLKLLGRAFGNPRRTCTVLLCAALAGSVPAGGYWLVTDIAHSTSMAEEAAQFIREELPEDAVIVVGDQYCAQFSAYCPDTRFYSLSLQRFITYSPHEKTAEHADQEKIRADLGNEKHLYSLSYIQQSPDDLPEDTVYYGHTEYIPSYGIEGTVTIRKFTLDSGALNDMESGSEDVVFTQ